MLWRRRKVGETSVLAFSLLGLPLQQGTLVSADGGAGPGVGYFRPSLLLGESQEGSEKTQFLKTVALVTEKRSSTQSCSLSRMPACLSLCPSG